MCSLVDLGLAPEHKHPRTSPSSPKSPIAWMPLADDGFVYVGQQRSEDEVRARKAAKGVLKTSPAV